MAYSITIGTNGREVETRLRADADKHPAVLSAALSRLAYFARLDSQESAKKELDRPKPYTLKAINYSKSSRSTLRSSVFINKNNDYIHMVVYGGIRRNRGRILVPDKSLRTDKYGNLSRTRRRNLLRNPKTFKVARGGKEFLMRRVGKRVKFVASLERSTKYKTKGYWNFHDSNLKTYDRRFGLLFNEQFYKMIKKT